MKTKTQEIKQKQVFLKSYPRFKEIEEALKILKKDKESNLQVSILGKVAKKKPGDLQNLIIQENAIKTRCEKLCEYPIEFKVLSNPEIGTIFITEFLAPIFLQKVGRKTIGALSTGPYGILRGLGIDEVRAILYLKALHKGDFLLILRGYKNELNQIEDNLRELT
ncbi:hypothetical protein [Polaribacter sp. Hel1_85]|uniref:hypothetical protein n=1 Tax=Polaribacter sp. Hel1_85 TaxID=1250005 RepID=UPI00052D5723|nr:hypothetical protein [Polaribacter sp. Hel1_85]KGL64296.1 hypothetical protein PHEL85_1350 [Polaribacter sp. Hel1_85]